MIFDGDRIEQIRKLAITSGLHAPEKRGFLFFDMSEYEATLPRKDNPSDQVLSDLQRMSEAGWVSDIIPLVIWLRAAANQAKLFVERTASFSQYADEAAKTPRPTVFFGLFNARPMEPTGAAPDAPPTPGPIPLDAARKGSLVNGIEGCLTIEDLQASLQKCLGDVPNLSSAPGQATPPVRELALRCIEFVERQKLIVVFLQFVIATARCTDELRNAALAIFPELATASQPFAAIVDDAVNYFKSNAEPIAAVLGDKSLANQFFLSVVELKCYKALHEAIHQLKNSPPPAAPEETASAIREFKLGLRQYLTSLNMARTRAQGALDELPDASGVRAAKQPAITLIGGYANRIEAALGRNDIDAAVTALEDTADAINPMLEEFNQNIVEMANRLLDGPLDRLRSAIAGASAVAGPLPTGVNVMAALRLALLTRVLGHTRWQEVDNSLFSLGGTFRSEPAGAFKRFARRWSVARKQIPILTDSDSNLDTARLQALARKVDTALVEAEKSIGADDNAFNSVVLDPFDEFRYETQQQFLRIDGALKRNCAELVRIVKIA